MGHQLHLAGTVIIITIFTAIGGLNVLMCREAASQQFYYSYICIFVQNVNNILYSNILGSESDVP